MNYFTFYVRDYDADTKGLTLVEHGTYGQLLRLSYDSERPLTHDRLGLYKLVNARTKTERQAVDSVLLRFYTETAEGWVQKRVLRELAKMRVRVEAARNNGKRGGRPSKAETQSVVDAARLEHAPANPMGFDQDADFPANGKPNGFAGENPTESYLHNYIKNNRVSDTSVVAREAGGTATPMLQNEKAAAAPLTKTPPPRYGRHRRAALRAKSDGTP